MVNFILGLLVIPFIALLAIIVYVAQYHIRRFRLRGVESAIVHGSDLKLKIGKYRLYRVDLRMNSRWFILNHEIQKQYKTGLHRISLFKNSVFIYIK